MSEIDTTSVANAFPALPGRRHLASGIWIALICIILVLLPIVTRSQFVITIGTTTLITAIAAAALHLVVRTGHVSLGHAGFMGVGAYAATLLLTELHWSFVPSLCAGFVAPGLLGLVVGPFVLRLTGKYFVLVTFIVGEILRVLMENWTSLTGGASGIFNIPAPPNFTAAIPFYYFVLVITIVLVAGISRIFSSEIGRTMDAVRQSQRLAQCSGIPVLKVKTAVFALSCGLVGIAGVLQSWFIHFIDPGSFSVTQSLNLLIINVIGGMNSLFGTLVGTLFITMLPELLRGYVELQRVIFGIILIIVMAALPGGLAELGSRIRQMIARRVQS